MRRDRGGARRRSCAWHFPLLAIAGLVWWSMDKVGALAHSLLRFVLLLTPPLPFPWGDAGVHLPAPLVLLLGLLSSAVRLTALEAAREYPLLFLALCGAFSWRCSPVTRLSQAVYSGRGHRARPLAARAGTVRDPRVRIPVCALGASRKKKQDNPLDFAQFLFVTGAAAALFACLDYFFQFPTPAGFGAQYVWLDEGMFRRAQGLFYEASTLGNFCAFFLIMIARGVERRALPHSTRSKTVALARGSDRILSRLNPFLFASLDRERDHWLPRTHVPAASEVWGRTLFPAACLARGWLQESLIRLALPSFERSNLLDKNRSLSVQYFWYLPDGVLSGRLTHCGEIIRDFLLREPWHAVFGVGYKTLPYSHFVRGERVIVDNTWLSLFAETGLFGLASFLL